MRNIGIGSWGEDVKTLQQMLNSYGFNLAVDGIFGVNTRKAVEDFQSQNTDETGAPLIVDGITGPKTWWALTNPAGAPPGAVGRNSSVIIGLIVAGIGAYFLLK